jgi:murein DD-endopeptidase MepM/ murein hydrolase activator NlpD
LDDESLPPAARMRRGLAEGMLGGGVALVALTVAHATLPDPAPAPPPPAAVAALAAPPPASPGPPVLIAFHDPLPDGEVGSPFGLRELPWEAAPRLHAGVDIVTPGPEPVLAAADGVVTRIGQDPGYGRFVELTHAAGLVTLYGHLRRFAPGLSQGDAVKAGAPVGELGSTGSSTGPHLHFEVHDAHGRPMNPELFLGHVFVRREDLPLKAARRVPRGVRVAYVSRIPKARKAQMEAKLDGETAEAAGDGATVETTGAMKIVTRSSHGRVRTHITF